MMMNKNIFKPEDLYTVKGISGLQMEVICNLLNAKLNALIESAPVVYGPAKSAFYSWTGHQSNQDTHKARLMFIEEIVKELCKHEVVFDERGFTFNPICKHCGVELQATWSEKK